MRSGYCFLGRLEDEADPSGEILYLAEHSGDPGPDCRVSVVPACMHGPVDLGREGDSRLLLDGEGVEVGSKPDDRSFAPDLESKPCARRVKPGL